MASFLHHLQDVRLHRVGYSRPTVTLFGNLLIFSLRDGHHAALEKI